MLASTFTAALDHPYLQSKDVRAFGIHLNTGGSLKLHASEEKPQHWGAAGDLLVPARAIDGTLLGAQSIAPDGRKSFPRGAALVGAHHLIGEIAPGGPLLIAEGYATAATLHEATGLPVVVAFNAGNLEPVVRAYRQRFPALALIIAGDNDHKLERQIGADGRPKTNVGRVKAEAAARAVGGVTLIPPFTPEQDGSDWNDLARLQGDGFARLFRGALAAAERRLTVIGGRDVAHQQAPSQPETATPARMRGAR
jgi:putative DNA primase/helicase